MGCTGQPLSLSHQKLPGFTPCTFNTKSSLPMLSLYTSHAEAGLYQNPALRHLCDWQVLDPQQRLDYTHKPDVPPQCSTTSIVVSRARGAGPLCAFRLGRLMFNCTPDWKRSQNQETRNTISPAPSTRRSSHPRSSIARANTLNSFEDAVPAWHSDEKSSTAENNSQEAH